MMKKDAIFKQSIDDCRITDGGQYTISNLPHDKYGEFDENALSYAAISRCRPLQLLNAASYDPLAYEPLCAEVDALREEETYADRAEYLQQLPTWQCQQHLCEILQGTSLDWKLLAIQTDISGCSLLVAHRESLPDGTAQVVEFMLPAWADFTITAETADGMRHTYIQLIVKRFTGEELLRQAVFKLLPNGQAETTTIEQSPLRTGQTWLITTVSS